MNLFLSISKSTQILRIVIFLCYVSSRAQKSHEMAKKTGRLFAISKFSFDKYGIYWVVPGESSCLEGSDSQYAWLRGVGSLSG